MPPFGTIPGEVARAALAGGVFLVLFALAELWRHFRHPPAEWTRKLVHLGGGLVAASFPWLFAWHWTVLALGSVFFLILWGTRRLGLLQSVHGVERRSEGGLYYPISVYVLFLVASGRPVFYLIALLAMVVSDTAAAVLGSSYGRVGYTVEHDRRTVEGSAVFFFSTFLIVHLPLLLLTDTPPLLSVLVGFQLALLMTLFEAISMRGNDNLIVPLVTYFLLLKLTRREADFLAYQIVSQLLIMSLVALLAWRFHFLTASGAMGFMLFFYGAYSLGGEEWTVAPAVALAAFTAYYLMRCRRPGRPDPKYQVAAAFYVAIVPGVLYIANNILETMLADPRFAAADPFYGLFLGAVAAQLALVVYDTDPAVPHSQRARLAIGMLGPVAAFLAVVPLGLLVSFEDAARTVALAAAVVVLSGLVHFLTRRFLHPKDLRPRERGRWMLRLQALSVAIGSALVVPLALG